MSSPSWTADDGDHQPARRSSGCSPARRRCGRCVTSTSRSRQASTWRSSDRRARASRRCSTCSGCSTARRAASTSSTASTSARMSERERAWLRAERLGFVFQSFHLLAHRTALENVMFGGMYQGLRASGAAATRRVRPWSRWGMAAPGHVPARPPVGRRASARRRRPGASPIRAVDPVVRRADRQPRLGQHGVDPGAVRRARRRRPDDVRDHPRPRRRHPRAQREGPDRRRPARRRCRRRPQQRWSGE